MTRARCSATSTSSSAATAPPATPAASRSLQRNVDHLEARIVELAREDRERAERPDLDGQAVMEHLGIARPARLGQALADLLELRRQRGGAVPAHDEALAALDVGGGAGDLAGRADRRR